MSRIRRGVGYLKPMRINVPFLFGFIRPLGTNATALLMARTEIEDRSGGLTLSVRWFLIC
jgi:hypothetical protein